MLLKTSLKKAIKIRKMKKYRKQSFGNQEKYCCHCGKKGHTNDTLYEYKHLKKEKKVNLSTTNNANMMEKNIKDIIAMVSNMKINIITKIHMAIANKPYD